MFEKDELFNLTRHLSRVQKYAMIFCDDLGIPKEYSHEINIAAFLHDIGKLKINQKILNKPGKLTSREYGVIKDHVEHSVIMAEAVKMPIEVVDIIKEHHENFDGTGYPDGLKGDEIILGARILKIVDVFDSLVTDRPYRKAMSQREALREMIKDRNNFDINLLKVFIEITQQKLVNCEMVLKEVNS